MAWRSGDYEPQGGWSAPHRVVLWTIWLFGSAFFAGVIITVLSLLPGADGWWVIAVSILGGSGLAAAVVKPWRG